MKNKKFFKLVIYAELNEDIKIAPRAKGYKFQIPKGLEQKSFFDKTGNLTEISTILINSMLVETLSANIHLADKQGYSDSHEIFGHVISDLEILSKKNYTIDSNIKKPEEFKSKK